MKDGMMETVETTGHGLRPHTNGATSSQPLKPWLAATATTHGSLPLQVLKSTITRPTMNGSSLTHQATHTITIQNGPGAQKPKNGTYGRTSTINGLFHPTEPSNTPSERMGIEFLYLKFKYIFW